jgi:hypothetical protein
MRTILQHTQRTSSGFDTTQAMLAALGVGAYAAVLSMFIAALARR